MTVRELLAKLRQHDMDTELMVWVDDTYNAMGDVCLGYMTNDSEEPEVIVRF